MKIDKIKFTSLRNDGHFQYHTEFRDIVVQFTPQALKIEPQFNAWLALFGQEDTAMNRISKSILTEDMKVADRRRNTVYRGMVTINTGMLNLFWQDMQVAARQLQVVFDTFGNIARKPINEKTSSITNLLQELKGARAEDIKTISLTSFVQELEKANNEFERLVKNRYDEMASRTDLVMKQVRPQVDAAYRVITERIDALMIVEGGEVLENFIRRLNAVIEKYK
ncbi:MAG: DUF6261 family protein [Bacteroidales bacterium]|jgi:hypothetical protein|nr:DUF6261 family protein [Bacteroidales bacterium]